MKARSLVNRRVAVSADAFAEMVVWHLPAPLAGSAHRFKYRLAYVVGGTCVLRYDNEAGKGDHRHIGDVESAYAFTTPDAMVSDFFNDIQRWNDEHNHA